MIARVVDPRNAWIYGPELGVDAAVNQADILAHLALEELSLGGMRILLKLRRGQYDLIEEEVRPGAKVDGSLVSDLRLPDRCVMVGVIRSGELELGPTTTTEEQRHRRAERHRSLEDAVVVQAPDHIVENARLVAKAGDDPKKLRKVQRKKPPEGFVTWTEDTFERLVAAEPEPLQSRMRVTHGMLLNVIAREGDPFESMRRLPAETELALFRIGQAALHNVELHGAADDVDVELIFEPDCVRLCVTDDGCGFEVPHNLDELPRVGKLGLVGMRERAELVGGTLQLTSRPGAGTRVDVQVPA